MSDVMNPQLLVLVALVLSAAALIGLLRVRAAVRRRTARRRAAGYYLMDCMKAYTAWIDWHNEEPMRYQRPQDAAVPPALARAVHLKDQHFPELAPFIAELLQCHQELMQCVWEENILRMTHSAHLLARSANPHYHLVRDRQDAALDGLFLRCRQLIGDTGPTWHHTQTDFRFSS
jgi:hypothetical protein